MPTKDDKIRKFFNAPGHVAVYHGAETTPMPLPGDILLSISNNKLQYTLFNVRYGYRFTHGARCMGGWGLTEALDDGIVPTQMKRYNKAHYAILTWPGITDEQRKKIIEKSQPYIGKGYDWGGLIWMVGQGAIDVAGTVLLPFKNFAWGMKAIAWLMKKRNLLDAKNRYFCTEYLGKVDSEVGLPVDEICESIGTLAPANYARKLTWKWIHARK